MTKRDGTESEIREMDIEVEVNAFFKEASVLHRQFETVMKEAEGAFRSAHLGDLRSSVCAVGETSAGKSHVRAQILKRHPRIETPEATEIPVVAVELSGGRSNLAGLYVRLLDALGATAKEKRGRVDDQILATTNRLKVAKTRLVIIDEFHHVLREGTRSMETANSLKDFLNISGIPVLLLGLSEGLRLLDLDAQLRSRFPHVFDLKVFSSSGEGFEDFCAFLGGWSEQMEVLLGKPHFLDEPHLAHRILRACQGRPGHIWAILKAACKQAKKEGAFELSLKHLRDGFEKDCGNLVRSEGNPFEMLLEKVLQMRVTPVESWEQARRTRAGETVKRRESDVESVLKRHR